MKKTSTSQVVQSIPTNLVLFDFDGTLTRKDTLLEFIRFTKGTWTLYTQLLLLIPWLVGMKLKWLDNGAVKERLLRRIFKGTSRRQFTEWGQAFCEANFTTLMRPDGLKKINELQKTNTRIILITASLDRWVQPFTDSIGIELIATQLAFEQNKFTGYFSTPNCYGTEKLTRLKTYLSTNTPPAFTMYGDSAGDETLYKAAQEYHHRYFTE